MYSVDFKTDEKWVMYATGLTASESVQIGRMLLELGYEVQLRGSDVGDTQEPGPEETKLEPNPPANSSVY